MLRHGVRRVGLGRCLQKQLHLRARTQVAKQDGMGRRYVSSKDSDAANAAGLRSLGRIDDFLKSLPDVNEIDPDGLQDTVPLPLKDEDWDEDVRGPPAVVLPEAGAADGSFTPEQIVDILEQRRTQNVEVLDVGEECTFAKVFILATGRAQRQMRSAAWDIRRMFHSAGLYAQIQGLETDWVVVDCGDIVVHILTEDAREHFQLESLWLKEMKSNPEAGMEYPHISPLSDEWSSKERVK